MSSRLLIVIAAIGCCLPLRGANGSTAPDPAVFDAILKGYVLDNGTVKYAALKAAPAALNAYVEQIGAVSPDSHPALFPSRAHRLAYWLNTYNALVMAQSFTIETNKSVAFDVELQITGPVTFTAGS